MPLWVEWLKTGLMVGTAVFAGLMAMDRWRKRQIVEELRLTARLTSVEAMAQDAVQQHEVWRVALIDMDKRIVEIDRRVGEKDRRHRTVDG